MSYRPEIDGLRAIAVLPVILFHAGFDLFKGGFLGVDIFLVISGYLITALMINDISQNTFSLINFYQKRVRRIMPALFFVMAVCIPFAFLLLTPSDLKSFGESLFATSTSTSNFLFWWERGYFSVLELKPLLHTWSLALEGQFYLVMPIFMLFTWRFGHKKIVSLLAILFLVSLSVAHISSNYGVYERVTTGAFYLFPTRVWEFILGILAAFYLNKFKSSKPSLLKNILSMIGFFMIFFSIFYFDNNTAFPSAYSLIPTIGTLMIILYGSEGTLVNKFLSLKSLVFFGLISYSAYLWHQPVFAFARHRFSSELSAHWLILLTIISILFAILSWKWIETPFRSQKMISSSSIFRISILGILSFSSIGILLSTSNGLLDLRNENERQIYEQFLNIGDYSTVNMAKANLKRFDQSDSRKNLFIVGDSYAEDLVNSVLESNLKTKYQISTYRIPSICGVLFIELDRLEEYQQTQCYGRPNFFNEPILIQVLSEADEVWIASSWMDWQLDFMAESIKRIKRLNNKITLYGSKEFHLKSASQFKNEYGLEGLNASFKISDRQKRLRKKLLEIAQTNDIRYIDTMFIICNSKNICKNSFDGKNILSVDGSHLTKYGAKYFGANLSVYLSKEDI